jgi:hypothetical protein
MGTRACYLRASEQVKCRRDSQEVERDIHQGVELSSLTLGFNRSTETLDNKRVKGYSISSKRRGQPVSQHNQARRIEGSSTMENSSSPAVVTSIVASTFLEPEFTLVSSTRLDRGSTGLGSSTRENEEEIKKSLEDDLLGLVGRMKGYAQNYKEQISRDNKVRLYELT